MFQAHRRYDISDRAWDLLERHLPGRKGSWGGIAQDNRLFISTVLGLSERVLRGVIYRLNKPEQKGAQQQDTSGLRMVCRSELLLRKVPVRIAKKQAA